MNVAINGSARSLGATATIADAVRAWGADPEGRGLAVALAGEVVPKAEWTQHRLNEGDELEVVHAVQGG